MAIIASSHKKTSIPKKEEHHFRELVAFALVGAGLLIFFALVSYNPWDPSLTTATHRQVSNWIGPVGAYVADVIHQMIGLSAYLVAWLPLGLGVTTLLKKNSQALGFKFITFLVFTLSVSALSDLILGHKKGGFIGQSISQFLVSRLGQLGTSVVLLCLFIILASLLLRISILAAFKTIALACSSVALNIGLFLKQNLVRLTKRIKKQQPFSTSSKEKSLVDVEPLDINQKTTSHDSVKNHEIYQDGPKTISQLKQDHVPTVAHQLIKKSDDIEIEEIKEPSKSISLQKKELKADSEDAQKQTIPLNTDKSTPKNQPQSVVQTNKNAPPSVIKGKDILPPANLGNAPLIVDLRPNEDISQSIKIFDKKQLDHHIQSPKKFELPPIALLDYDAPERIPINRELLLQNAQKLERKLKDYSIEGHVVEIRPGPVVTMYEFLPAPGIKVSKISSLSDDLAMAMEAMRVRIVAPIPGKGVVGIEIPNDRRETVYLKEIISHQVFMNAESKLTLSIGKDIEGKPFVSDLAKCPHLLVAGATGSGKSVSINSIVLSLLYRATPDDVKLIMVDPKMLELSIYEGIPHLLLPVVTDPKKASLALRWAVEEMERRYTLLSEAGVRNITGYNKKLEKILADWDTHHPTPSDPAEEFENKSLEKPKKMPYIVVLIDELADLMMVASKEVETSICRLAQMARAAGIHLILATQRPSVDVLTGVIKANFPARISFQVASKHDARTILDTIGSENLLGQGDMLMIPPGNMGIVRVHGTYVSEVEIQRVVDFLKQQGQPEYDDSILKPRDDDESLELEEEFDDELYDQAVAIVSQMRTVSVSLLQRKMRIGYNRSARMIERMEKEGIVSAGDGAKPRDVLVSSFEDNET